MKDSNKTESVPGTKVETPEVPEVPEAKSQVTLASLKQAFMDKPETTMESLANQVRTEEAKEEVVQAVNSTETPETYQTYVSTKSSTKLIDPKGKVAIFRNGMLYTNDEDIISWIDSEIKNSSAFGGTITKGKRISADELNPIVALEKKIRRQVMIDMGLDPDGSNVKSGVVSTSDMGAVAGPSNSGVAVTSAAE